MGKEPCPSKIHFARCVTQVEGRPDKVTWKCDHCGKHVISGAFRAANARIHLVAEKTNGVFSILCDSMDDHAEGRRQEFRKLIKTLANKKQEKARKRKQQLYRLDQRNEKLEREKRAREWAGENISQEDEGYGDPRLGCQFAYHCI